MGNSARVALSLLCLCVVAGVRATDEGGDNVAAASAIASEDVEAFRSAQESATECTTRRSLCIFDFDHTLKLGSRYDCCGYMPDQSLEAVRACQSNGFDIAVASANTHWDFVRSFLKDNYPQFAGMVYTEAVQTGQSYKATSLSAVLRHYQMEETPECAVFFDDLWSNKKYADATGIPFEKVDPQRGVSTANVQSGLAKARENCRCGLN